MCFNLILLQQNVINNWITFSISIMPIGNAISTRASFVYAAPVRDTCTILSRGEYLYEWNTFTCSAWPPALQKSINNTINVRLERCTRKFNAETIHVMRLWCGYDAIIARKLYCVNFILSSWMNVNKFPRIDHSKLSTEAGIPSVLHTYIHVMRLWCDNCPKVILC